jgi:hypothetical protein
MYPAFIQGAELCTANEDARRQRCDGVVVNVPASVTVWREARQTNRVLRSASPSKTPVGSTLIMLCESDLDGSVGLSSINGEHRCNESRRVW